MADGKVPQNADWFVDGKEPDSLITCPCGATTPLGQWRDVEPGCGDCGNHVGIECPACGRWFDHVWDKDALSG